MTPKAALAALAFLLISGSAGEALAQEHEHERMQQEAQNAKSTQKDKARRADKMQEHMKQMHQRMARMDQELQQKLSVMEKAEGEQRIDAMAAVIRTLAEQQLRMHEQRQDMMQKMSTRRQTMGKGMERGRMMHPGETEESAK